MTFKTTLIGTLALSMLSVLAATGAQAQNTRAAVKAEAVGAAASQPKGELSVPNQDKGAKPIAGLFG